MPCCHDVPIIRWIELGVCANECLVDRVVPHLARITDTADVSASGANDFVTEVTALRARHRGITRDEHQRKSVAVERRNEGERSLKDAKSHFGLTCETIHVVRANG